MHNHAPPDYHCPFCLIVQGIENDQVYTVASDIVYHDESVTAFIGSHQWPRNPGNVIIIPNAHYENIYELPIEYAAQIHFVAQKVALALKKALACEGISTRQHNEPAGNQDVWHYHLHVTPRYHGDALYATLTTQRQFIAVEERAKLAQQIKEQMATTTTKIYPPSIDSTLGPLQITPATTSELDAIVAIFDEAAGWLNAKGVRQWDSPTPASVVDFLRDELEAKRVFIVRQQTTNAALGTFRLTQSDSALWGDAHDTGEAIYLYSLAVRPSFKGHKIGVAILNWVKGYIKSLNRKFFRLDCLATNAVLRRYYENLGFVFRAEVKQGEFTFALYELAL